MAKKQRRQISDAVAPVIETDAIAPSQTEPVIWWALGAIVLLGIALRLWYIHQPVRYDEAVTYLYFARHSWWEAMSDYRYPNNHVFHTLLVKVAVNLFSNEPWVLRLPAFFAGVLTIPATFLVGKKLHNERSGLLASAFVATSGALVLYSTNARGYAMVILATLVALYLAARAREQSSVTLWICYALVGAFGFWTIPTMLYPLGGVTLWYLADLVRRKKIAGFSVPAAEMLMPIAASIGAVVVGLLLYLPVIQRSGFAALLGNKFVTPDPMERFATNLPADIFKTIQLFLLGVPLPVLAIFLVIIVVGVRLRQPEDRSSQLLLPVMLVWCAALLVVMHRYPFPRVWLFWIPLIAIAAAAEGARALNRVSWRSVRPPIPSVILVALFALTTVATGAVLESTETGTLPDANQIALDLKRQLRAGDKILVGIPGNAPLSYWMDHWSIDSSYMTRSSEGADRYFLIVDKGAGQDVDNEIGRLGANDTTLFAKPRIISDYRKSAVVEIAWKVPRQ